jgi:hypothetical protein
VASQGDDESDMVEAAHGDFHFFRRDLGCCQESLNVTAPGDVLVVRQGDEEVSCVNMPSQDRLILGRGRLPKELRQGEEIIPNGSLLCMDRSSQQVDHEW